MNSIHGKYLGETLVDAENHPDFKDYSPSDWSIYFIEGYAQIDGSHHKLWVLDQVARILKGTKVVVNIAKWADGHEEPRVTLAEPSKRYLKWRKEIAGEHYEDGTTEYEYDEGIAP